MRTRVEAVGPAWRCGEGGPWSALDGRSAGAARVGDRVVTWVRRGDAVEVTHDTTTSLLARLLGAVPALESYAVGLAAGRSGSDVVAVPSVRTAGGPPVPAVGSAAAGVPALLRARVRLRVPAQGEGRVAPWC